eukprot:6195770-Pleurochrysis_carterae.AAC.2
MASSDPVCHGNAKPTGSYVNAIAQARAAAANDESGHGACAGRLRGIQSRDTGSSRKETYKCGADLSAGRLIQAQTNISSH